MQRAESNTTERAEGAGELKVEIIIGSTRPGRKAGAVARWVHGVAAPREDAAFEVADVAAYALPHLDEPVPPLAPATTAGPTRRGGPRRLRRSTPTYS